jgi:hypothetical protein
MVPQGCQNDARAAKLKPQGCPKGAQMAARATKMAPRGTKKTHKCIIRCKSVGADATMKPPGPSQCPKEATPFKTQTKRLPRPGARRRRRRSGRGLEGRAHQAARRDPRSGAEAGIKVTSSKVLFLTSINWVPPLPPNHEISSRGHPKRHKKNIEKTKGTHGGPKTENKGPEP